MTDAVSAFQSEEDPDPTRLPVTIITGFLGSGKTTLLNHILANQRGLRIAVMVNEIGEIGIDSELIVSTDNDMTELSNGCICCSLNNNLVDAIFRVLERDPRIDYLVVEATGLADPLPIILTFLRSEFRDRVLLDAIIAVVDAENFRDDIFNGQAAYNQLRYADVILLNKCDLVDDGCLHTIEGKIRGIRAGARIVRTTRSAVPLPLILSVRLFDSMGAARSHDEEGRNHLTSDGFSVVSFASTQPLALDKFQYFLDRQLPDDVFRGKGILWIDKSDKRYVFQLVGKRFSLDESWWVRPRSNRLVLIGRNLDDGRLRAQLEACLVRASDDPGPLSEHRQHLHNQVGEDLR